MPKAKQYIAVSKISSDIAYFKTISQYRQAMDDLLGGNARARIR